MNAATPTQHALITGASAGIGADLARRFARDGYGLVLVARSPERLEAVASELRAIGVPVLALSIDLSVPGAAATVHDQVTRAGLDIEVLVNDAGFGMHGRFIELDAARQLEMIQVNVAALTALTRRFAPAMVQRGRGRILNVASTAAFQPGPLMAVYCATKAYVLSFSEAIGDELRGTGVSVTCVAPGPTVTRFREVAGMAASKLFRSHTMASASVAEAAYTAMKNGKALVVPGMRNLLLAMIARLAPIGVGARVARHLLENVPAADRP